MIDTALVSCDDHLDLNMLPEDVWSSRMAARWGDRTPRVEQKEDGPAVWMADGESWGSWAGKRSSFAGPKPIHTAYDRGGVEDLTELRAGRPQLRLADMDRDGVWAHVVFGPVTSIKTRDEAFMRACYAAYNDWLYEDFCSAAPDRLVGVAMLPPYPEAAYDELKRLALKGGVRQANLQIAVAEPRLEDKRWEPLFDLLEQSGIILSFHVTVFPGVTKAFDKYKGSPGATFLHAKMFIDQFLDPFVDLFAWGILERHPKLKIVIAECGVGWVPWVIEELDYRHWRLWECADFWADKGGIPLKKKPSELFREQVYGTFQQSPTAMRLLEFWGPENLLWASDYPHPDSVWPNSRQAIGETMGHLPSATVQQLVGGNAAKLYGLDLSKATVRATLPIGEKAAA
ncbi:amidohydrolase family protein [Altererythrobacter soli]|uniref:Amidohydrolase family protein n=1 Tax=Croceibacterium soli TaxID=1739690 RepID=A0A6I4UXR2_9SPHN|nr:amidohydrolase family protein [Croceibacterium soli]MXP42579.1 amidohydrolase family protein [Croceibacterium soli]